MARTHYLHDEQVHYTWDTGNQPVLEIDSGDTVDVWTRDVSDNQIGPDSDTSVIDDVDWDRSYPLTGPIAIAGAQPGDTLAIEILDIHTQGWGWTAILPESGLLPEDFPDAYLRVFDLSRGDVAYMRDDIAIPLEPFFGTMGVCPADAHERCTRHQLSAEYADVAPALERAPAANEPHARAASRRTTAARSDSSTSKRACGSSSASGSSSRSRRQDRKSGRTCAFSASEPKGW